MNLETLLKNSNVDSLPVLDANIPLKCNIEIDLSVANKELQAIDISSVEVCEKYISNYLKKHNAQVAYGGYLEKRNLYKGVSNFIGSENRNIHLGIDLWCDEETTVLAVLDGEVHSFQNNNTIGNYGPTIILRHRFEGIEFYSLYGHLSEASLDNLQAGQKVTQGETIAMLGSEKINGGYAPHLHFQLIKDLQGMSGDYPGVCSEENLDFYMKNCPDPNLLLKLK